MSLYLSPGSGGAIQNQPAYKIASSTLYAVGPDISIQILAEKSKRAYVKICNDSPSNPAYIVFGSTAGTATTSANLPINVDECETFRAPFIWGGVMQVISETSTTTSLFVTEFSD